MHTNSPKIPVKSVYPAGGQSRPPLQRAGGRKRLVGADDSVGPKNVANSPEITVKTVRSAGPMWASAPTNARFGGSPKFAAFESPQSASLTAPLVLKGSLGAYEFAEDSRKIGISCGRTESSAPTTRRGAKTTCRGRRLCRPEKCCEFAGDYCKNSALCRADVGIGPYKCEVRRLSKICSVRIPSVSFADSSPCAQGEPLARAFKHKNLAP